MEISLEKILIGILIGILLFCIGKKMFMVEGVTGNSCMSEPPCTTEACVYDLKGCSYTPSDPYGGVGCIGSTGCRFCGKPGHKPCGGHSPPAPPSPPTPPSPYHPPSPPSPPSPPTPPSSPTNNICSKLDPATCLNYDDYGGNCVHQDDPNNFGNYICNNGIIEESKCGTEGEGSTGRGFKWCKNGPYRNPVENPQGYNVDVWNNTGRKVYVQINIQENYGTAFDNYWQAYLIQGINGYWKQSLQSNHKLVRWDGRTRDKYYIWYTLPNNSSLRFKPKSGNMSWKAGNITVVSEQPSSTIDTGGLTKLEYTIDPPIISSNISAVDGFNIDVELRYYNANGENFDDTNTLRCDILNKLDQIPEFCSEDSIRCHVPTVEQMGAQEWQESILREDPFSCEDVDGAPGIKNCAGCPTGKNSCYPFSNPFAKCDLNEKRKKWGCYRFWYDNDKNPNAKKWLDLFDDKCPIYGWAYDEGFLGGKLSPFKDTKYNNFLKGCPEVSNDITCDSWKDSKEGQCANGLLPLNECEKLDTYLIKSPKDLPKHISNIDHTTLISFKINNIL